MCRLALQLLGMLSNVIGMLCNVLGMLATSSAVLGMFQLIRQQVGGFLFDVRLLGPC